MDIPQTVFEKFTYCYDDQNTGIDSLLRIDGFYVIAESLKSKGYNSDKDSSYFNLMFYKNGICVFNLLPVDQEGKFNDNRFMPSFFKTVIEEKDGIEASYFYRVPKWGRYVVEGDTIKAQYIYRPRKGEATKIWTIHEVWYQIIDRSTIVEVYPSTNKVTRNLHAHFVPVKEKPKPNSWLIREDWFWCDGVRDSLLLKKP